jgi:exopolysaccharide biosynthesis polyprenyl glycosylphosphotransferase
MRNQKRISGFTFLNIVFYFVAMRLIGVRNDLAVNIVFISIATLYYLFNIYYSDDEIEVSLMSSAINVFAVFISFNTIRLGKALSLHLIMFIYQMITFYILNNFMRMKKNVLIIGDHPQKDEILEMIEKNHEYSEVIQMTDDDEGLLNLNNLTGLIFRKEIGEVAVLSKRDDGITNNLLRLKMEGLRVYDFYGFYEEVEGKVAVEALDEEKLLLDNGFDIYHNSFQKRIKRSLDVVLSLIVGIVTLPIMLLSMIIIKTESRGPVFFVQERVGFDNKPFKIVKFRSMKVHDENEHSKYAGKNDSRITGYGRVMRKTRIDELPQIWNVLRGDMSFIGPRAEWSKLSEEYEEKIAFYPLRHSVKPGLTGWAQVSYPYGAGLEDMKIKLMYDFYYIKHQSLSLDVKIIFKTIRTVLFGKGQ